MTTRRAFCTGMAASAATLLAMPGFAQTARPRLQMPPLVDTTASGQFTLAAQRGQVNFLGQRASETWGFNQPYLGPTLRVAHKGEVQANVSNQLDEEISVHWHGLLVPGEVDGGPHNPIAAGGNWAPVLPIDQPQATLWYHSHIHGRTATHVSNGLAGVLQITDGQDDARGLPSNYGVDDLMVVLQDRQFDRAGRMVYDPARRDLMMGFLGDAMVINGQVSPVAVVPKGIVRLRLLNGSNSRIYVLSLADGRPMHLIASDNGLLDQPVEITRLALASGERAEVLVDFSGGGGTSLVSASNPNQGMMGGMMGNNRQTQGNFTVLPIEVDSTLPARITALPDARAGALGGSLAQIPQADLAGATRRDITLDMQMGMGMMMGGLFGGSRFSINGEAYDMRRLNFTVKRGSTEIWRIRGQMMMHPFHVHGVSFQVISENGGPVAARNRGWKDMILVNGEAEIAMQFNHPAAATTPYMFHCHILEHEDGGMMGQFAVV